MHDLTTETLVAIQDVHKLPIFAARKAPPTLTTIYSWMKKGFRGVKLETTTLGISRFSSVEAVQRFIRATNNLPKPEPRVRLLPATLAEIDPD